MNRSFSNRLFGGVCGGFANTLPFNAWIWRLIFILLTLATMGVGALVYVMMWWLLPLDSPLQRTSGGAITGLISLLLAIGLVGAWFARETLTISDSYWSLAFLVLAIVFLLKQVFTGRWQNVSFGLVALAIPIVLLLRDYNVLADGLLDILERSWAAILVFLGLAITLRDRVRFGSWIALIISGLLVVGLASFAYSSRVDVVSESNQLALTIPNEDEHELTAIGEEVTTLVVNVTTLDTDVVISVSDTGERLIEGAFVGSNNSQIDTNYNEDGSIATMQLTEVQASDFPRLEDVGRGSLNLQIPPDIAFGLTFNGGRAETVTLDMGELNLESLFVELDEGDVLIRLPEYQPLSPSVVESNGVWLVRDGNLDVLVPSELGVRLSFARTSNAEPTGFDDLAYQLLLEGDDFVLASRQFDNLDAQVRYRVDLSGGRFNLEVAQ